MAEANKIRIAHTPGNESRFDNQFPEIPASRQQYSTVVDESYLVIGDHVDLVVRQKIKRGEYIDFAKLIP